MHVSTVARVTNASVSAAHGRDLGALEPAAWHARGLGDFWQHTLVAEGLLDAAVDAHLAHWDYAALIAALAVAPATGRGTLEDDDAESSAGLA